MGTKATTSSRSFGETYLPRVNLDFDGKQVDRVYVDERWGTRELYFLRVCACLRRGTPWNRE